METAAVVSALKTGALCAGGVGVTLLCIWGCYKLYKTFWNEEAPFKIKGRNGELITTVDDLIDEFKPMLKNSDGNNKNQKKSKEEEKREKELKELEEKIRSLQVQLEKDDFKEKLQQVFEQQKEEMRQTFQEQKNQLQQIINQLTAELQVALQREGVQRSAPPVCREELVQNWLNARATGSEAAGDTYYSSTCSGSTGTPVTENEEKPRWSQMSLEEKKKQKCHTCGKQAQIITKKCGHPVLCLECYNNIYPQMGQGKSIKQCPVCDRYFEEERVPIKIKLVE